ncbi:hypothetical protein HOLleu_00666 [Holothuria leucospilota]|uniref:Uncharacterized protein n=1 Tax=Holothuria leucospilota TaxID=206669 RepID=A0A9Q1CPF4_HOLLE|nr:hypothetical protein HOLleu_00666 [Holothuria leucospilota]
MATQKRRTELIKQRRSRRGALTRVLNTLKTVIDQGQDTDSKTVRELLGKGDEGFAAVEAIHQELVDTAEDEEASKLEAWMEEVHKSFWEIKMLAKRYLHSKGENSMDLKSKEVPSSDGTGSGSTNQFSEIKLALELPKAGVKEFKGDPIDFYMLTSNFETNVATKLSNNPTFAICNTNVQRQST